MPVIKISVVICTHNRSELLREALLSVLESNYPMEHYELIVVDNNSTDATRTLVEELSSRYDHVRYVLEINIGLSHARNRGWQEAQGEYVGYLDDDAKASHAWLSTADEVAATVHPEAFGGPYYAFYKMPKPAWFKDEYGSHVQGKVPRILETNEYLDGGNMFIRRKILDQLNGFSTDFGMQGNKIAFGEETDFFERLRSRIPESRLYYHPALYIYHLVRPEKFNLWQAPKRNFLSGRYSRKLRYESMDSSKKGLFKWSMVIILKLFKSLTVDLLLRDRKQYPYYQNHLIEKTLPIIAQLGEIFERFYYSPRQV